MTAGIKRAAPEEGFNRYSDQRPASLFYDIEKLPLGSWDNSLLDYLRNSLLPADYNWSHSYRLGEKESDDASWDDSWPKDDFDHRYVSLRIACEEYAKNINLDEKQNLLNKVETLILELKEDWFPSDGVALPYSVLNKFSLIGLVYRLEDDPLTNLFAAHLPIPSSSYFTNCKVPDFITKIEAEKNAAVRSFFEKNKESDFKTLEKSVLLFQRIIRSNRRKEEEAHRLEVNEVPTCLPHYVPKCDSVLADRIVRLSTQIVFVQFIRHICNEKALPSIFDGALYGRKSLLRHYIPFYPAALQWEDIENGDSDVICFGKKDGIIDPLAGGSIEFILDLKKIDLTKKYAPYCSFFKQRDLAFYLNSGSEGLKMMAIRSLQVTPEKKFLFDTTSAKPGWFRCKYEDKNKFFENCNDSFRSPEKLISYNVANMNAELILSFFKSLDKIKGPIGDEFYSDISRMSDEGLIELLKEIGENISIMMEFNFYGSHQIDFDSLESVVNKESNFSLHIPSLLQELQSGKLDLYQKAKERIPTLFQSYRFLDYLISKADSHPVSEVLSKQRSLCKAPSYFTEFKV